MAGRTGEDIGKRDSRVSLIKFSSPRFGCRQIPCEIMNRDCFTPQHSDALTTRYFIGIRFRKHAVLLSAVAIFLIGCGGNSGLDRAEVKGNVSFDGEPVAEGTISLIPEGGTKSPGGGGPIVDGKYVIDREKGPTPGTYLVHIHGRRKTGKEIPAGPPAPPGAMAPEIEQYIPPQFNTQTTLKIELESGSNTHDFSLTGDRKGN